jgi:hypothetical protein
MKGLEMDMKLVKLHIGNHIFQRRNKMKLQRSLMREFVKGGENRVERVFGSLERKMLIVHYMGSKEKWSLIWHTIVEFSSSNE